MPAPIYENVRPQSADHIQYFRPVTDRYPKNTFNHHFDCRRGDIRSNQPHTSEKYLTSTSALYSADHPSYEKQSETNT
jgi:hypothetical protein